MGEEIHSHKLIQSSSGVITLTGTVGLESLVYGKNVIVLGEIFFNSFKGVLHPKGWDELRNILNSEFFYKTSNKSEEAIMFYAATYLSSFKGCTFGIGGKSDRLTNENKQNSADYILKKFFYDKK